MAGFCSWCCRVRILRTASGEFDFACICVLFFGFHLFQLTLHLLFFRRK
jgi:hypothetical protein